MWTYLTATLGDPLCDIGKSVVRYGKSKSTGALTSHFQAKHREIFDENLQVEAEPPRVATGRFGQSTTIPVTYWFCQYRRVPHVLCLKRALGFIFTVKITEKKFLRENTISSNTAFNFNLITDSDSAEFSKEFDLFEFLCLAFLIEIFTAGGTEHGKNHFFDPKLHLNLTS